MDKEAIESMNNALQEINKVQLEKTKEFAKEVKEDGSISLNGAEYNVSQLFKLPVVERADIFALKTKFDTESKKDGGSMMYTKSGDYKQVRKVIEDNVLFDGMQLSKIPTHWEEHTNNYFSLIETCLAVLAADFL